MWRWGGAESTNWSHCSLKLQSQDNMPHLLHLSMYFQIFLSQILDTSLLAVLGHRGMLKLLVIKDDSKIFHFHVLDSVPTMSMLCMKPYDALARCVSQFVDIGFTLYQIDFIPPQMNTRWPTSLFIIL